MKQETQETRARIKSLVGEVLEYRRRIHELAWKPGVEGDVQRLRSERNAEGQRVHGKRALKAFRRPETGWDRCELNWKKIGLREEIRHYLCLLGMLRRRPYARVEAKAAVLPSAKQIHVYLKSVFSGTPPYTEGQIESWLQGQALPSAEAA